MYYNIDEVLKRKDEIFEIKYVKRKKVKIQMYEVIYSMNGVIKKIDIKADDGVTAQAIFTNMFGGGAIEIIDVVRK